ncbi:hypothetical protein KDL44_00990 [bacterium]|nr:hypothetical protein [bacterium]
MDTPQKNISNSYQKASVWLCVFAFLLCFVPLLNLMLAIAALLTGFAAIQFAAKHRQSSTVPVVTIVGAALLTCISLVLVLGYFGSGSQKFAARVELTRYCEDFDPSQASREELLEFCRRTEEFKARYNASTGYEQKLDQVQKAIRKIDQEERFRDNINMVIQCEPDTMNSPADLTQLEGMLFVIDEVKADPTMLEDHFSEDDIDLFYQHAEEIEQLVTALHREQGREAQVPNAE